MSSLAESYVDLHSKTIDPIRVLQKYAIQTTEGANVLAPNFKKYDVLNYKGLYGRAVPTELWHGLLKRMEEVIERVGTNWKWIGSFGPVIARPK